MRRCSKGLPLPFVFNQAWSLLLAAAICSPVVKAQELSSEVASFIDQRCSSCHNDEDKKGGLDLTALVRAH